MTQLVAEALISSPAFPTVNEKVRVELRITNRSENAARNVQVELFDGPNKAGSAVVNAGARQTVSTFFDWLPGSEGLRRLTAIVDPEHRLVEEDYADNVAAVEVAVTSSEAKAADISVSNLEVVNEGGRSLLRATLTNQGKATANVPLVFKADNRLIANRFLTGLGAGKRTVVDVEIPDGISPTRIAVEANPRFREFSKRPTLLTKEVRQSVDLRVEALSVSAAQFEASRPRRVTISFRIVNAGNRPVSKPFRTSIFPGSAKSGRLETDFIQTPALAAGSTVYVSRTVDSPSGEFEVRIEADADRAISEANESNNVVTSRFKNPVPDVDRWVTIGPRRINEGLGAVGVLMGVAVDPQAPATIYVSIVRGGVWKTVDDGANWQPITDALPSLNVAAFAIDPANPARVFVATQDFGVFVSNDGGGVWSPLDPSTFRPSLAGQETLIVDRTNPNVLLLTSMTGVWVHNAAAATNKWTQTLDGPATDLITDTSSAGKYFATLAGNNSKGQNVTGIFRSFDSGQGWTRLFGCPGASLPDTSDVQKITVAVSGNTLYAAFKTRKEKFEVFRTTSTGFGCSIGGQPEDPWERRFTLTDPDPDHAPNPVGELFNRINADPSDPKFVYISGVPFKRSSDGGSSFSVADGAQPHVDHHALTVDPNDSRIIYIVSDGGIYRSSNRGAEGTWQFLGDGIFNVQFYDAALSVTDRTMVIGGTQDNGTLEYSGTTDWSHINSGDGATVAIDPTNSQIKYSMNQGPESMQKRVGQGDWSCISCGQLALLDRCFNLAFQVHPRTPSIILAPCQSLWQATSPVCTKCPNRDEKDPGAPISWKEILRESLVGGDVVKVTVDPTINLYYAGTSSGEVWAGPGGLGFQKIFSTGGGISDIEVDLDDPATVYVSVVGAGRVFRLRRANDAPTQTTVISTDITSNLPAGLQVNALAVDRMNSFTIYAGTNSGVYAARSLDRGGTWRWGSYMNGLPLADVRDLEVHPITGLMLAATFGRSAYEVNTGDPVGSVLTATGKIAFLRVNDLGTGFGPPPDFLDAEAIVLLDSQPGKGFGFTLRNDSDRADHQGMLDVLRSAFTRNRTVKIDYIRTGFRNGKLIHAETID